MAKFSALVLACTLLACKSKSLPKQNKQAETHIQNLDAHRCSGQRIYPPEYNQEKILTELTALQLTYSHLQKQHGHSSTFSQLISPSIRETIEQIEKELAPKKTAGLNLTETARSAKSLTFYPQTHWVDANKHILKVLNKNWDLNAIEFSQLKQSVLDLSESEAKAIKDKISLSMLRDPDGIYTQDEIKAIASMNDADLLRFSDQVTQGKLEEEWPQAMHGFFEKRQKERAFLSSVQSDPKSPYFVEPELRDLKSNRKFLQREIASLEATVSSQTQIYRDIEQRVLKGETVDIFVEGRVKQLNGVNVEKIQTAISFRKLKSKADLKPGSVLHQMGVAEAGAANLLKAQYGHKVRLHGAEESLANARAFEVMAQRGADFSDPIVLEAVDTAREKIALEHIANSKVKNPILLYGAAHNFKQHLDKNPNFKQIDLVQKPFRPQNLSANPFSISLKPQKAGALSALSSKQVFAVLGAGGLLAAGLGVGLGFLISQHNKQQHSLKLTCSH